MHCLKLLAFLFCTAAFIVSCPQAGIAVKYSDVNDSASVASVILVQGGSIILFLSPVFVFGIVFFKFIPKRFRDRMTYACVMGSGRAGGRRKRRRTVYICACMCVRLTRWNPS